MEAGLPLFLEVEVFQEFHDTVFVAPAGLQARAALQQDLILVVAEVTGSIEVQGVEQDRPVDAEEEIAFELFLQGLQRLSQQILCVCRR